jgi:hypothetical protein
MPPRSLWHLPTFFAGALLAVSTSAQTPSLEKTFVEAFIGHCILNLPNLEKIRAASRLLGWKPLSGDAAVMLGPLDRGAKAEMWLATEKEMWLATEKGDLFLIGISTSAIGTQPTVSCSMAHPKLQQSEMSEELSKNLTLKFLSDEGEAGKRYRSWTTSANGYNVLVMLTSLRDPNSLGVTVAASVKVR